MPVPEQERISDDPHPYGEYMTVVSALDGTTADYLSACQVHAAQPGDKSRELVRTLSQRHGEAFQLTASYLSRGTTLDDYQLQMAGLLNQLSAQRSEAMNLIVGSELVPARLVSRMVFQDSPDSEGGPDQVLQTFQEGLAAYYTDTLQQDTDAFTGAVTDIWANRPHARESAISRNALGLGALAFGAVAAAYMGIRAFRRRR